MFVIREKVKNFVKEVFWMDTKNIDNLTVVNLEQKMKQKHFDNGLIKELLYIFEQRILNHGQKYFQEWLFNLNFRCPDEFQNEKKAAQIYDKYYSWIEEEVNKLENETKLSWEEQTEDIKKLNTKARKTQLVIRHRLSEIILDVI